MTPTSSEYLLAVNYSSAKSSFFASRGKLGFWVLRAWGHVCRAMENPMKDETKLGLPGVCSGLLCSETPYQEIDPHAISILR